jgi:uncharacterized membrane protein
MTESPESPSANAFPAKESHLRSVLKSISWRALGTFDTMVITFIVTRKFSTAITVGSVEVVTKMILYYLHERAWQMVPRGAVRRWWRRSR